MDLFKPEVYEKLEKKIKGPAYNNELIKAFDLIRADTKLQQFLKEYARKNNIEKDFGIYWSGNKEADLILWKKNLPHGGYDIITLCPDRDRTIMPLLYRNETYVGKDTYGNIDGFVSSYYIIKKSGFNYVLAQEKMSCSYGREYNKKNVTEMDLFRKVTKKDILDGLDRVIHKILRTRENNNKNKSEV